MHLVGCNKITKHKNLGDLRIEKVRKTSTSMLGKLIWGLHRDCDSLWVRVLKEKYITEEKFLNMKNKSESVTWNKTMKALTALKDDFEFRLGDGIFSSVFQLVRGREIS